MKPRVKRDEWYMNLAAETAKRSTCLRRCYGAILVNARDEVVATGYNGSPRTNKHCDEKGTCLRDTLNIPSGERYELCCSVHAEQNALIQAGRNAAGCTLYLAGFNRKTGEPDYSTPCFLCTKLLINARVFGVILRTTEGDGYVWVPPQRLYDTYIKNLKPDWSITDDTDTDVKQT